MTDIYKITIKKSQVVNDLKNFKDFKETKQNFTIINHPLGHFEKGSIKKVKIEEGYIYLGNLKPQFKSLKGSGILSRFLKKTKDKIKDKVVDVFSPRLNDYNNQTKRMMAKYGHEQVVSMAIYRTPIPSMINKVLNVVSFGKWNELKKKYGFDKFFHLALVLTLKNHKNIIVEKNEVISVSDSYKTNSDTEVLPVDNYTTPITVNYLLDKTRKAFKNDALFFGYDPLTNNCQVFIKKILESNGLYTPTINNFLFQDIEELTKELSPLTKGIMRGTTNLAGTVNKLTGQGRKTKFIKVNKGLVGMKGNGIIEDIMKIERDDERVYKYYKQKSKEVIDYIPFFIEKYKNKDVCIENRNYHLDINPDKKNKDDFVKRINEDDIFVFEDFKILDKIIEKCKKRLLIIPTTLDSIFFSKERDKINHQTGFIIDKKLKTVEYYDPHGKDSHNYSQDLDDTFNDIFKKLGYRYLFMEETCPDYSFQDIEDELVKDKKLKKILQNLKEESQKNKIGFQAIDEFAGNKIGFCFSWTFFYIENRIENPDIDPQKLKERINKEFENNPFKYIDFIIKYALYLVKSTTPKEVIEEEQKKSEEEQYQKEEYPKKIKKMKKIVEDYLKEKSVVRNNSEFQKKLFKEFKLGLSDLINSLLEEINDLWKKYEENEKKMNENEEDEELVDKIGSENEELFDFIQEKKKEVRKIAYEFGYNIPEF
jgi:hypothetical protein